MVEGLIRYWNQQSVVRAGGIGVALLCITLLHHVTPLSHFYWHDIFQHLYYLPVVAAALAFGWRGGLLAAAVAGLSHTPYIIAVSTVEPRTAVGQGVEIPLLALVGLLTGILSEREREQRKELERTSVELASVYRELQDNFERMKRAERLYAVGQLSAGLAHEIRNPLASIGGAVGLLDRNSASDRVRAECIGIIKKENERLNQLLTRFLDFARPRPPKFRAIDILAVLDSVIDLAAHALSEKPIVLRKEIDRGLGTLDCDPEQLKQVLLNLLINAVQAMDRAGEILLAARVVQGKVLIQVKDQGCGIPPEHRNRIFDPFFTTKESGTGLGLAVAHQIVEQHGGILTVEHNGDRGTTFSVLLPSRREEAA